MFREVGIEKLRDDDIIEPSTGMVFRMIDPEEDYQGPAHPGTPLEPDELPASPSGFSPWQGPRQEPPEPKSHPTVSLSSLTKKTAGKPSSGTHPTAQLSVKSKGRQK